MPAATLSGTHSVLSTDIVCVLRLLYLFHERNAGVVRTRRTNPAHAVAAEVFIVPRLDLNMDDMVAMNTSKGVGLEYAGTYLFATKAVKVNPLRDRTEDFCIPTRVTHYISLTIIVPVTVPV